MQEKELKKITKKASNLIGTYYFLLLGVLQLPMYYLLKVANIQIISWIWTIFIPLIGAKILLKLALQNTLNYITPQNLELVVKAVKKQLILVGIWDILLANGANFYILTPNIFVYVISSIEIINTIKKQAQNKFRQQTN